MSMRTKHVHTYWKVEMKPFLLSEESCTVLVTVGFRIANNIRSCIHVGDIQTVNVVLGNCSKNVGNYALQLKCYDFKD